MTRSYMFTDDSTEVHYTGFNREVDQAELIAIVIGEGGSLDVFALDDHDKSVDELRRYLADTDPFAKITGIFWKFWKTVG